MERLQYQDFDLKIERDGSRYRAVVLQSPGGEGSSYFEPPFTEEKLELMLLKLGLGLRKGVRGHRTPEMQIACELGGKLFESAFCGDVLTCLKGSLDAVAERERAGLRIRMRLQDVPELSDLPWEFLYDPKQKFFLAQSVETPIVRWVEKTEKIPPLKVELPLRVLVVVSSPSDYDRLDVEKEKNNLQTALEPLVKENRLEIEYLPDARMSTLQRSLRKGNYHVFHFIGHGLFDRKEDQGKLVLEDASGQAMPVEAQRIGTLLHDHDSLRLVVLNACEGARNSRTDPFAGVASTLVSHHGIPAVAAMQFEITDEAAITFATEFYSVLAEGFPVDAALSEARKAIYLKPNDVEWGTPVLYMRSQDGVLFSVPEPTVRRAGDAVKGSTISHGVEHKPDIFESPKEPQKPPWLQIAFGGFAIAIIALLLLYFLAPSSIDVAKQPETPAMQAPAGQKRTFGAPSISLPAPGPIRDEAILPVPPGMQAPAEQKPPQGASTIVTVTEPTSPSAPAPTRAVAKPSVPPAMQAPAGQKPPHGGSTAAPVTKPTYPSAPDPPREVAKQPVARENPVLEEPKPPDKGGEATPGSTPKSPSDQVLLNPKGLRLTP